MLAAATFFSVYESVKARAEPLVSPAYAPLVHMAAASVGEMVSDLAEERL